MFDRRNSSSSAPPPVVTQENVKATLKWFNPTKGFGFVATADGAGDVFLHVSAVQGIDPNSLQPGVTLTVDLGQGRRGLQVVAVHEVDESTAEPEAPRKPRFGGGQDRGYGGGGQDRGYGGGQDRGYGGGQDRGYGGGQDRGYGGGRDRGYGGGQESAGGSGEWVEGTMKFFNQQRGFGFVAPDGGGGQDVFLHLSALTRAQVATPADGQRVRYTTKQGRKGLEVDQIELA